MLYASFDRFITTFPAVFCTMAKIKGVYRCVLPVFRSVKTDIEQPGREHGTLLLSVKINDRVTNVTKMSHTAYCGI